ncbi:MAG: hypothetical protein OEX19_04080 [Gammaproteobacteria bacterium]|nr:hypothetical protein [Gammaproteobacteria bacterium]
MLTDIITYGFCIAIAIGAIFAWANAETKYRAQRHKIYELASQLRSAQRDLRTTQTQSGSTDSKSKKYHETLIKIGAILGASEDKSDAGAKIYSLLSGVAPEAVLTVKRPKGGSAGKRDKEETENVFHRMKEKLGTG